MLTPPSTTSTSPGTSASMGARICERVDALAAISAEKGAITRVFMSPEQKRASDLVLGWMTEAGMDARVDAIGNVVGRYEGATPGAPAILLASHLDTVRNAGRWDGVLGVVTGIECVAALARDGIRLPHAIEVVGFSDEEGARFGATMLGSKALAGAFDPSLLKLRDGNGVTMADAIRAYGLDPERIGAARRDPSEIAAYLELHIEQGPVLENCKLPIGCVSAICGATRLAVTLTGAAGHAGTVPMNQRADALVGAAAAVLAVEQAATATRGLVATVGRLMVEPGGANVIPGHVAFTVDVRAPQDNQRFSTLKRIEESIVAIASTRGLGVSIERIHDESAALCDRALQDRIDAAIEAQRYEPLRLASGAGHDAMVMSRIAPIGMIFVRCRAGLSHHPDEHAEPRDVDAGARALLHVLKSFENAPL
ncbi:allantoate amidohydrolase [Methylopila sp. Yamaguchi]|uniref:allantoate amidohydrolase n=1 Tax=Methylopila sp. Yamaguchi TaxID=1437817 RepID=UPI001FCE519E|nr:allantoate amidohydrolase [Methylopila sp. Yamaguchi]